MFGEGKFAPYIGEMTSVIKMRLDDSMSDPLKQVTELQRLTKERDASCAKLLALRLEGALVTPEPWTARMVREIVRLYQANLGPQLCKAVGKMYQLRAESALGFKARLNQLGFGGGDDAVQFVSGAAKAIGAAAEMQKMAADGSPEANSREKVEAQMFDMMALDSMCQIQPAPCILWPPKPRQRFQALRDRFPRDASVSTCFLRTDRIHAMWRSRRHHQQCGLALPARYVHRQARAAQSRQGPPKARGALQRHCGGARCAVRAARADIGAQISTRGKRLLWAR